MPRRFHRADSKLCFKYDGMRVRAQPQPTAKKNSMQGLATIQKRLLDTDPDLHAKQIMHLKLDMAAKEQLLQDKELANAKLQEQLSWCGEACIRVFSFLSCICARCKVWALNDD